ncbi:hypothetical protein QBZ16_001637 [Prototheca wickerhamii]|uniref:UPF3 domain-containing protein n=1 Tax=Prototheca wickerhamii TaxID=3111 RepID=A0AAD9ID07_PROWI|nr:hypothetical protein QBZ16_001637 [Prototheca wickerhamii]
MAVAESRTKVVVRRLPPALEEATFRAALGQWMDRTNWIDYCAGRVTPKKAVSSRAYLNFNTPGDAMQFLEGARNQNLSLEDSNREYLAFVAAMEAGGEAVSLPAVERRTDPEGPTPLVKYLLERQAAAAKRGKSGAKAAKDKGPEKKPSEAPAGAVKKDAEKKQKTKGQGARDSSKKPVQILQRRAAEPGEAEGAAALSGAGPSPP